MIALISGNVLGMAAANGWVELVWAGSAALLVFNLAVPRRTVSAAVPAPAVVPAPTDVPAPAVAPAPAVGPVVAVEPVTPAGQ